MKTSLGIWAFGSMATRFNPGGYKPELAGVSTAEKVRTAVEGLGDLVDGYGMYCIASGLHLNPLFQRGGFCALDDGVRDEALRLTFEAIDLAAEVGGRMIIWPGIEGYNYPFQTPYAECWARFLDGVGRSAQHARERGVTIFLEHKNS